MTSSVPYPMLGQEKTGVVRWEIVTPTAGFAQVTLARELAHNSLTDTLTLLEESTKVLLWV